MWRRLTTHSARHSGRKAAGDVNEEKGPDSVKSKADIMKFLNDSFAYLHKALATLNGENLVAPIQWGEKPATRLQIALMAAGTHGITTGRWWSICG